MNQERAVEARDKAKIFYRNGIVVFVDLQWRGGRVARAPRGDGEEREEMPPPMCASTLTRMSRPHSRPVVTFSAPCATGLKSAAEVEPKAAHPVAVGFGLQRIVIDIFPSSGGVADFSSGEYNREVWR